MSTKQTVRTCTCGRCLSVHRADYLSCPHCGAAAVPVKKEAVLYAYDSRNVSLVG